MMSASAAPHAPRTRDASAASTPETSSHAARTTGLWPNTAARIAPSAPSAPTVIMTGFGTVETAIDAMKRGAYDYILKPFKVEEVIHVVQRGIEKQKLAAENIRLKEAISLYKVSEAIQASLSLEQVLATVSDTALHE